MGQITPQMVKELRDKTGAGMGDCKKALVEVDGDLQTAIEFLRKKGAASAAKRADKSANEGLINATTSVDGKTASVVEINCETDFVAMNEGFVKYVNNVSKALMENDPKNVEELLALEVSNDTVQGLHNEILAKFSEKIEIRRFEKIKSEGYITAYIHAGSKLAVLLETNIANPDDSAKSLQRDIAMQIAAMNPQFISRDQVSQENIQKEIEIYKDAAIQEGKKPEIAERIATGRLDKFYQESCLIEQIFVKDSKKTVGDIVTEISTAVGSEVKVLSFRRFFLGEEIN